MARLLAAVEAYPQVWEMLHHSDFVADLAGGLAAEGESAAALAVLDQTLAAADRTGVGWHLAEFPRTKGEVLLRRREGEAALEGEKFLRSALEVARRQGALTWESRAAVGLARLEWRRGRGGDGAALLGAVYGRFTEGFGTADLRSARALLDV